jgi:hypothetical protein
MPRQQKTHRHHAAELLEQSHLTEVGPDHAAMLRQEATVHAMLAIAEELAGAREEIQGVARALEDPNGYGVGLYLNYINEALKDLARRQ